jgi:hypothetical protein
MASGKKITVGGQEFTLSAVPAIGLKKIGPRMQLIGSTASEEAIDALVDAIYYGVKRNHPEAERDHFEWNIDVTNVQELVEAFAEVNTVAPRAEGAPGEA